MRSNWGTYTPRGDAQKAMAALYKLAHLEQMPPRFALGKATFAAIKAKAASVTANVEQYEEWSADLEKAL